MTIHIKPGRELRRVYGFLVEIPSKEEIEAKKARLKPNKAIPDLPYEAVKPKWLLEVLCPSSIVRERVILKKFSPLKIRRLTDALLRKYPHNGYRVEYSKYIKGERIPNLMTVEYIAGKPKVWVKSGTNIVYIDYIFKYDEEGKPYGR